MLSTALLRELRQIPILLLHVAAKVRKSTNVNVKDIVITIAERTLFLPRLLPQYIYCNLSWIGNNGDLRDTLDSYES